jgi:outer membrane protein assembly factor BamB
LIARDAFNGLGLWRRHVPKWGAEELRCSGDVLLLRRQRNTVMAIDIQSGKRRWEATGRIQPFSLAARDGKVLYQDGQQILCKRITDGQEIWQIDHKTPLLLLLVGDDAVVLLDRKTMQAVAVDTGQTLWTAEDAVQRRELFIAQRRLWHWDGDRVVGRDLQSGQATTRLDTKEVFTPGHHFRCYQSKATEDFLITPNRGAEFVSLTGGQHTQNDWARGPCGYGIMPCNGLLYVPPHPCFCYPGVKLTGFNALAPAVAKNEAIPRTRPAKRLQKGPAYENAEVSARSTQNADDWPTYRHDARRSGATDCEVAPEVSERWEVQLQGEITPPVVASSRVFVAVKDKHSVDAFDTEDGRKLWSYTAGGRIDSPPTAHGALLLFGCTDGCVYCLRASDGALVWRFRAAPSEQLISADGQLESPWSVHGSILLRRGVAYCTAGRSSYLDGGIFLFALDPQTGKVLHQARLDDWARTRADADDKPFIAGYHMEGARSDILVSQGDAIYLGQAKFDLNLVRQEVPYVMPGPDDQTVALDLSDEPYVVPDAEPEQDYEKHQRDWLERTQKGLLQALRQRCGAYSLGQREMGLHVLSTAGFLDDSWFNRTYWMYSSTWPGYYIAHRAAKTGQLLVVGPEKTYAVQAYPSRNLQSPLFTPGWQGYLLLADNNENEPALDHRTRGTTKGWGFTRSQPPAWHQWVPLRVRAMVLAGEQLFVAGPPDVVDAADPMAAFEGRKGGLLWTISPGDGAKRAARTLEAPVVFDGIIAARGRLFVSLQGGKLLCLGGAPLEIGD